MPHIVIAGVGFVGLATARLFRAAGWEVTGITHSEESAAALAADGIRGVACDISQRAAVDALGVNAPDAVIHCASSGRGGADAYRAVTSVSQAWIRTSFKGRSLSRSGSSASVVGNSG